VSLLRLALGTSEARKTYDGAEFQGFCLNARPRALPEIRLSLVGAFNRSLIGGLADIPRAESGAR
jgi:hypothetical protein